MTPIDQDTTVDDVFTKGNCHMQGVLNTCQGGPACRKTKRTAVKGLPDKQARVCFSSCMLGLMFFTTGVSMVGYVVASMPSGLGKSLQLIMCLHT